MNETFTEQNDPRSPPVVISYALASTASAILSDGGAGGGGSANIGFSAVLGVHGTVTNPNTFGFGPNVGINTAASTNGAVSWSIIDPTPPPPPGGVSRILSGSLLIAFTPARGSVVAPGLQGQVNLATTASGVTATSNGAELRVAWTNGTTPMVYDNPNFFSGPNQVNITFAVDTPAPVETLVAGSALGVNFQPAPGGGGALASLTVNFTEGVGIG